MRDKKNEKAVVLLSGGVDSSTTLAIAKSVGHVLYAISFDYGQRHRIELESAKMVAENLGVEKHLIVNFDLRDIGGSALTSEIEVPKIKGQEANAECGMRNETAKSERILQNLELNPSALRTLYEPLAPHGSCPTGHRPGHRPHSELIPITYVPARNTIFLSFALGWAEVIGANNIFIGANAVDYSGYPDCRPEYLKAFEDMANLATKASVEGKTRFSIKAPLLFMTKAEILKKGIELGLDYTLTWSCYDPQPLEGQGARGKGQVDSELRTVFIPCSRCDSCLFRAKGFREAGVIDPLLSG